MFSGDTSNKARTEFETEPTLALSVLMVLDVGPCIGPDFLLMPDNDRPQVAEEFLKYIDYNCRLALHATSI